MLAALFQKGLYLTRNMQMVQRQAVRVRMGLAVTIPFLPCQSIEGFIQLFL